MYNLHLGGGAEMGRLEGLYIKFLHLLPYASGLQYEVTARGFKYIGRVYLVFDDRPAVTIVRGVSSNREWTHNNVKRRWKELRQLALKERCHVSNW